MVRSRLTVGIGGDQEGVAVDACDGQAATFDPVYRAGRWCCDPVDGQEGLVS